MIDAFKPSYLEHASYLKSLTEKYEHGELDMGIGHWRGVEVLFNGKSNTIAIFCKDGSDGYDSGSLGFVRGLVWLESFGKVGRFIIDSLINFPRLLKGHELLRTGNIPLNRLYKFDIAIKRHVGKKKNIDFIYFGELDRVGHKYGTKSPEIINAVRKIDKKISEMDFDLIFSDHGMADVEKLVKVPLSKNCFIDSDMARYWGKENEMITIRNRLPLEDGEIIDWPDKRFGDLVFLAKTGNLIFPNFWDKKPVKGMHGYDGKHKDMKAFYILKKAGERRDLEVEEIHEKIFGNRR